MSLKPEEIVAEYKRKRGNARASMTRLKNNFVDKIVPETSTEAITIRLESLERYFLEFCEAESVLSAFPTVPSELDEVEEKYFELKEKLREVSQRRNSTQADITSQLNETLKQFADSINRPASTSEVKVPRIQIPHFDGSYLEFPAFKDLFEASIHNNGNLSTVHKFQYLRGVLRGEAATLIRHIPVTEANYQGAYRKLLERYDKKKHLVSTLVRKFLDQATVAQGNYRSLRSIANSSDEVIRGLAALGDEANTRDPWLIHILLAKLDADSKRAWAEKAVSRDYPTFDEFLEFLNLRCDMLETCDSTVKKTQPPKPTSAKIFHLSTPTTEESSTQPSCLECGEAHSIRECKQFRLRTVSSRREFASKQGICFNCMSKNHRIANCKSRHRCTKCNGRHHTLLHNDATTSSATAAVVTEPDTPATQTDTHNDPKPSTSFESYHCSATPASTTTANNAMCAVLPTALAYVQDSIGKTHTCRILLDSGAQASFISEACMQRLGLPRNNARLLINGISGKGAYTKGKTLVSLTSRYSKETIHVPVYILDKLTSKLPSFRLEIAMKQLDGIQLADPHFNEPNIVDILLGADQFFQVLRDGRQQLQETSMYLQNTAFGCIIAGGLSLDPKLAMSATIEPLLNLDETLRKFWELEEVPAPKAIEREKCEEHFSTTFKRENDKYVVRYPFKEFPPKLGASFKPAVTRLHAMEKKFIRNPAFKSSYADFMQEYLALGHMRQLSPNEIALSNHHHYYLPHHAVFKNDDTRKIRVVFDGSAKSSNGLSLNDCLHVGPTIQPTLWTILIRFRGHKVAMVADIEKMYRQVEIDKRDRPYQRIVWRERETDPIGHFELNTVTYGTSSAPFLAIRTLHQVAQDFKDMFPDASKIALRDFYVDDLLTGAKNEAEAISLKNEITKLLSKGGLPLRKWKSNFDNLSDSCSSNVVISSKEEVNTVKILGLQWSPTTDVFTFRVKQLDPEQPTKRRVLSATSRIYDPLGWLGPSIIILKVLFQHLWLKKLEWDDPLPDDVAVTWNNIKEEFSFFEKISIPRFIQIDMVELQLHGFSDASENAYAAAVYCRGISATGVVKVDLITAKTKVAPLKQISIPRLELCGAHLLAKLMDKLVQEGLFPNAQLFAWTDSQVVLSWLNAIPRRWKTFVANRTADIIEKIPRACWNHVPSKENPADLASRGVTPSTLPGQELWWKGPTWLSTDPSNWPENRQSSSVEEVELEARKGIVAANSIIAQQNEVLEELCLRVSSWPKLNRVVSYASRFHQNCLSSKTGQPKQSGNLKVDELERAERLLIHWAQHQDFEEEMDQLKRGIPVQRGRLSSLTPFLDAYGILRVGGRLSESHCTYNAKHPIILSSKHHLTRMIVNYYHLKHLHAGPSLLFHILRQDFWILGARNLTRKEARSCVRCCRERAKVTTQLMGNLPPERVEMVAAFHKVGVDFAGPITLASKKGRGSRHIKGYLSVFVCLSTKAVHIEVVSDLSTDAFMAAFRRFTSRRGLPAEVWSDNGSNFEGANTKFKEIYDLHSSEEFQQKFGDHLLTNKIKWKFLPPTASHMAGVWESQIKILKSNIARVTGSAYLTFEEMSTLVAQIEGIMNSRPLNAIINEDSSNLDVLTPAHFLIFRPITSLPDTSTDDASINGLNRWQQIQNRVRGFWKRFSIEYIHSLQAKTKWRTVNENLKQNDIVLIKQENTPPTVWPLAKVLEVHPGSDARVRVVTVRTSSSTFQRPISKLVRLPIE